MVIFKHPSTKVWIMIYIILPLTPFLLGGIIRLVISGWDLNLDTFNASELSIGFTLLCLFINQDLKKFEMEMPLRNEDKINEVKWKAWGFLIFCFIFMALFIINISIEAVIQFHKVITLEKSLHNFQLFVFLLAIFIAYWSISVQQSFKLKANI